MKQGVALLSRGQGKCEPRNEKMFLGRGKAAYNLYNYVRLSSELETATIVQIALTKASRISGGDAFRGNTRSHPEHDG